MLAPVRRIWVRRGRGGRRGRRQSSSSPAGRPRAGHPLAASAAAARVLPASWRPLPCLRPAARRRARGAAARGPEPGSGGGKGGLPSPGGRLSRRGPLGRRLILGLLLLVLAEVLGERLAARPGGANGVPRELDVGLLRGRLLGLRLRRRLDRRGDGGQLMAGAARLLFRRFCRGPSSAGFFLRRGRLLRLAPATPAPCRRSCRPGRCSPRGGRSR